MIFDCKNDQIRIYGMHALTMFSNAVDVPGILIAKH